MIKNNVFSGYDKFIITVATLFGLLLVLLFQNYDKIPSYKEHVNRNEYNVLPVGKLSHTKGDEYVDDGGVKWLKRAFYRNLFHNPLKYYTFETKANANANRGTSETSILIKGKKGFKDESFNYYSSYNHPVNHFFADILPIAIYFAPKYRVFNK